MYPRMKSILLSLSIGVVLPATAISQDVQRVSLDDALRTFAERNLELRLARANAMEVVGLTRQVSAFPNPVAYATHESLDANGLALSETYIGVNQEISWPWRQSASGGAANHMANAMQATVARDSLRLAFEVKQAFTRAGAAEERHVLVRRVRDVFRNVERAGSARYQEGDISGYHLRRMRIELARYETLAANETIDMRRARRTLATLVLGNANGEELGPDGTLAGLPPRHPTNAEQLALQHRPELDAARETALATDQAAGFARASRLPNPTLTGAYTTKTGGFKGFLFGLSWPVPLFDGHGQAVAASEARFERTIRQEELARQLVLADVRNALETFDVVTTNASVVGDRLLADYETVLTIANASYQEGEMSLIELLDAAEAFWEAGRALIDMRSRAWIAYFDLERAVGGFDTSAGDGDDR